jgi:hypothetical protein
VQSDPEYKREHSIRVREAVSHPDVKQAHLDGVHASWLLDSEELKDRLSYWDRPGYRDYHALRTKEALADPDVNRRQREGTRKALANLTEEARARMLHVGYRWINNGVADAKLAKDLSLPEGWKYGRHNLFYHHTRWHVNRGIVSPTCPYCIPP